MKTYIGTCDWNYDDWRNIFYPGDLSKIRFLEFYSRRYNSVEITSTYYRLPFINFVKLWKASTPDDFRFTVKMHWKITHKFKMNTDEKNILNINEFFKRIEFLKDKINVVVIQPQDIIEFDTEKIKKFLNALPNDYQYVIDAKNPDWHCPEFIDLCADYHVIPMSVSSPKLEYFPEHPRIKSCYVRLYGKIKENEYLYSEEDLIQIKNWILKNQFEEVYIYFNNPKEAFAIKNARLMNEVLNGAS